MGLWRRLGRSPAFWLGGALLAALLVAALFADDALWAWALRRPPEPILMRFDPIRPFVAESGAPPDANFWMGADLAGRDLFSRVLYGARVSLGVALLAQTIAALVGLPLGALAGWRGGLADTLVLRLIDLFAALPVLLLAFLIVARLGASLWNVVLAIALTSWIEFARLTRVLVRRLRRSDFVAAAHVMGIAPRRIVTRHLVPHMAGPLLVAWTLGLPRAILAEAGLSFLGMGINPPTPSWGQMLARDGVANMSYYGHLALFPALAIAVTLLAFTLVGDSLRDALDPESAPDFTPAHLRRPSKGPAA